MECFQILCFFSSLCRIKLLIYCKRSNNNNTRCLFDILQNNITLRSIYYVFCGFWSHHVIPSSRLCLHSFHSLFCVQIFVVASHSQNSFVFLIGNFWCTLHFRFLQPFVSVTSTVTYLIFWLILSTTVAVVSLRRLIVITGHADFSGLYKLIQRSNVTSSGFLFCVTSSPKLNDIKSIKINNKITGEGKTRKLTSQTLSIKVRQL